MKRFPILIVLAFLLSLTSCTAIVMKMYGMNEPKHISDEKIVELSEKYNIPPSDTYTLDTSYVNFLYSFDTVKYKNNIKDHLQPLQALYYNKNGQIESFHINCYAGGFPNLKWDRNDVMNTFPPQNQAPLDRLLPLDIHLKYIQKLPASDDISTDGYDYVIIVHWNRFMGRQSKKLIQAVQENAKLAENQKIKILYVNTDEVFSNYSF